jgi:hypothetical protein
MTSTKAVVARPTATWGAVAFHADAMLVDGNLGLRGFLEEVHATRLNRMLGSRVK